MSSPKLLVQKIGRQRPFRVLVLGQAGVGKTALTVRFITRRFIGEYDPTLERKYSFQASVDDESIPFEVMDTAAQDPQADSLHLEEHIRWADAFLLVFSLTDRCSLDHLTHLRVHIQHRALKKARRSKADASDTPPVLLIGNKSDLSNQRMVSASEAERRAEELACAAYHDVSARESYEEARSVFLAAWRAWKRNASPRKVLKRQEELRVSPPSPRRRSHRSSLFKYSQSSSTESDNAGGSGREGGGGGGAGGCGLGASGDFLEVRKEPIKRKPSVHKRIMMRVMPSFKISRESGDSDSHEQS